MSTEKQPEQAPAPYERPALVKHGKLADLTRSGQGPGSDYIDSTMRWPNDRPKGTIEDIEPGTVSEP